MVHVKDIEGKLSNKTKITIETMVIVSFVVLSTICAVNHEPWFDEAQAFLIARDSHSIREFINAVQYEGTPPGWHLILKLFLLFGGSYKAFFILPLIFSAVGVMLLEYKVKAPLYIKVLLPFTYFIAYQYTIIARSYTMVFPLLMLAVIFFEEKTKKPVRFTIVVILLELVCSYSFIMAGSFYLLYLIELFIKKTKDKRNNICAVVLFVSFLMVTVFCLPKFDNRYIPTSLGFKSIVSEAFLFSNNSSLWAFIISILCVICIVIFNVVDYKNRLWKFCILVVPVVSFLVFFSSQEWHIGMIMLAVVVASILNETFYEDIYAALFIVIFLIQISWAFNAYRFDIQNSYCSAEQAAEVLKVYVAENYPIYSFGDKNTAIQPYFDSNIFINHTDDFGYCPWSLDYEGENNKSDRVCYPDKQVLVYSEEKMFTDIYLLLNSSLSKNELVDMLLFRAYDFYVANYDLSDLEDKEFFSDIAIYGEDGYEIEEVYYFPAGLYYKTYELERNGYFVVVMDKAE